jgi:hypothetical protein
MKKIILLLLPLVIAIVAFRNTKQITITGNVMDKNPLENIYNTESIKYTMVNGRLYDAALMNEIGNYNKPHPKFY